jgi:predicted DNA-binding transcriptional regulator YafY
MIRQLYYKLKNNFSSRYYLVYKNKDGKIKTYQIGNINLFNSFGNKNDDRRNVGFRAYCFGRQEIRSFRHDRIISLTKR